MVACSCHNAYCVEPDGLTSEEDATNWCSGETSSAKGKISDVLDAVSTNCPSADLTAAIAFIVEGEVGELKIAIPGAEDAAVEHKSTAKYYAIACPPEKKPEMLVSNCKGEEASV